jgi:tetratricopeptide (TPR) repeat protein
MPYGIAFPVTLGLNGSMTEAKARSMLGEAMRAGRERDYPRAAELLSENDGPPEAFLLLGRARHAMGQHGAAILAYQAYLDRGGEAAAAFFFSGRSFLAMGLPGRAAEILQRCAELAPNSAQCLGLLGYALLKQGRASKAVDVLMRAVELAPEDGRIYRGYLNALFVSAVRCLSAGDADMALQMLSFVIDNGLEGLPPLMYRAKALFRMGRWEEALEAYDLIISRSGPDAALLMGKALALGALGRTREAQALWDDLRGSMEGLPESLPALQGYPALTAISALQRGLHREAADAALEGLRSAPRDALLHALAGEAYRALGGQAKAANHFKRALEVDPGNAGVRSALAASLWALGDLEGLEHELRALGRSGGSQDIVQYYSLLLESTRSEASPELLRRILKGIEAMGPDPELMRRAAEAAWDIGSPSLALPWYRRLSDISKPDPGLFGRLIDCLEELGPPEELEQAYQRALQSLPTEVGLRLRYAAKLLAVERWEDAYAQYEAALPQLQDKARCLRSMALCLRKAGRFREAAVIYRDLALKRPDDKAAAKGLIYCLFKMGRPALACAMAESAARHFHGQADMVCILACLLARAGKTEKALDALRRLADSAPADPSPWLMMADIHAARGSRESENRCRSQAEAIARELKKKGRPASTGRPRTPS